jgi:hypothetical protein
MVMLTQAQFVSEFEKRFIGEKGNVTLAVTNGDAMDVE